MPSGPRGKNRLSRPKACLPFFGSDTIHSSLRLSPARVPKSNRDEESKSRQDYIQIAKVTQKSRWDPFAMPDRILTSELSCEGPLVMDESGDEAGSQSGSTHHCSLLPHKRDYPRLLWRSGSGRQWQHGVSHPLSPCSFLHRRMEWYRKGSP